VRDSAWTSHNGETSLSLHQGHVLDVLREMPAGSVHCVVTSPPYLGLRDYKLEPQVWDGEEGCAWRGSLGLEPTPDLYVQHLVGVFREVRRVLRKDGTLFLNLGDSYFSGSNARPYSTSDTALRDSLGTEYLKPKDLVGMPWRVAFALQADGWFLRSDVIWSKPNPMPESVTDRPTKAHEYLFLLAKDERYFYDADAIREPSQGPEPWGARAPDGKAERDESQGRHGASSIFKGMTREEKMRWYGNGRTRRTVWEIATEPYPDAHFATFPTELVKPCILAGTSEKGVCPECGAPWEREVAAEGGSIGKSWHNNEHDLVVGQRQEAWVDFSAYRRQTTGWHPTCAHDKDPIPATVLDPFAGSGTTLLVATRLGRNGVGVELSPAYVQLTIKRLDEHKQQRLVLP